MPDEQVYFSQDKDALLRSKGFDPAMVYGKFQELGKFRNPSFSTSPLVETPIQVGSGYEYNDVNSFGEQLLNSYINQVYLTTPKSIVNFIPTVGLAIAKDNTSAAKFFDSWIKGATDFFDKGKQDVTPTESYLKSGSPLAFASSLGQGLGFVASMFAGSAVKAPAALGFFGKYVVGAAVSTPVLQSMYYEEAVNSGLDKKDAAIFSSVLAPISALSEYVGFEMMGNAITKPIISQVRKKALLEGVKEFAAKGATKAAFYDAASMSSKVYAQSMKELFSNLAVRGTRGAFAEGSQEFAQSYLEEGAKQVYDTYFAKGAQKKFGADVATNFKGAIEDAFFGGVIGAVLGGGGGAIYNPVFEESLFNVLDKAKNKEYAADKLKKDITAYVKKGKITEQEAAYGNQLVDGITNFVKTELPKTITDPIARFQALRLTDVKNDLTASLSGNPSLLPDYVPMQIERVESALKQIGNSNTPIADFNGLLMELVQIENEVKQKNGWNEGGGNAAEDTAVETAETGIGEAVEAGGQGIEGDNITAEVEVVEVGGQEVGQSVQPTVQVTLDAKKADIERRRQELESSREILTLYDLTKPITEDSKEIISKIEEANKLRKEAKVKSEQAAKETNEEKRIALNSDAASLNEKAQILDKEVKASRDSVINNTPIKQAITSAKILGQKLLNKIKLAAKSNEWVSSMPISKEEFTKFEDAIKRLSVKNMGEVTSNSEVIPDILLIEEINAKYDAELAALEKQKEPVSSDVDKKADIERRRQEELNKGILPNVPDYVKEEIDRNVKTNQNLLQKVRELAYQNKTKSEIAKELNVDKEIVNSLRTYLQIPSMDSKTEFQEWKSKIDEINSKYDKELAALDANQATTQAEEKPIAEQVAEYEGILTRNQDKLTKLRSSKLRKGETQEKRDAAIANLEQQESMVREKLDALKQQMPQVETPAVQSVFEQIGKLRDNITAKGGKRKEKKDAFTTFVAEQPERVRFVHDNFKNIVNQLESKGLLKKSSPEC